MIVVDGGLALMVNDPTGLDAMLASPGARKSALMSVCSRRGFAAERVVAAVWARQKMPTTSAVVPTASTESSENGGSWIEGRPRSGREPSRRGP